VLPHRDHRFAVPKTIRSRCPWKRECNTGERDLFPNWAGQAANHRRTQFRGSPAAKPPEIEDFKGITAWLGILLICAGLFS
jgi:hypothetical protein